MQTYVAICFQLAFPFFYRLTWNVQLRIVFEVVLEKALVLNLHK